MYSPRFIRCVLNVLSITNRVIIPCKGRAAVWSMLFNHLRAMQPCILDNHTHLRIISSLFHSTAAIRLLPNALPYSSDDSTHVPTLPVHGGAWPYPRTPRLDTGWRAPMRLKPATVSLRRTAPTRCVEAAVTILENDPTFDAGRGSFLTSRWPRPA